jgi:2-dehydro-3-deoxyphosphogluconate aldolase/(4S)-4-hydroxy-2-oxoglutarate aldolase
MDAINNPALFSSKIVVLLEIDKDTLAYDLAACLVDAGIDNLEIALRTPHSKSAAEIIKKNFDFVNVGLGTVTSLEDVDFAKDLAAKFAFAPDCKPEILKACLAKKLFFIPGVSTAQEIALAYEHGYRLLKYYPAESSGGVDKLAVLHNSLKDQNLRFIPSGGINVSNMQTYLDHSFVTAVAGSWIAPKSLINEKDWKEMATRAKQALKIAGH